jgi:hypothetical protein
VRRHRRDPAYLGWVLRSAAAGPALAVALLGFASQRPRPSLRSRRSPRIRSRVRRPEPARRPLGDLDGDGDLDLVSGDLAGELHYFANTGSRSTPSFEPRTGVANPFAGFDAGSDSAPALGDLDADGDLDLVVGINTGAFAYFENTGTATSPAFAAITGAASPLAGIAVSPRAVPALGDLDRDGDLDFVAGTNLGTFAYIENTGTATSPAFAALTGAANPLDGFSVATSAKPALADLDRDNDPRRPSRVAETAPSRPSRTRARP